MEKKKEIITKEIFIEEQRKLFKQETLLLFLVVLPLFSVLLLCISFVFSSPWLVFGILESLWIAVLTVAYGKIIKQWNGIKKGEFCVMQDTLQGSSPGHGTHSTSTISKPYTLYFSTYGKYAVPTHNYTWSKDFSATDEDVYNRACKGDTFYIFLSGKTILAAYNTKVFEYVEHCTKEDC